MHSSVLPAFHVERNVGLESDLSSQPRAASGLRQQARCRKVDGAPLMLLRETRLLLPPPLLLRLCLRLLLLRWAHA